MTDRIRAQIFYPSQINLFRECPERYFHKHVERRRVSEPFSRPLARGIALHGMLADAANELRSQRSVPANLRDLAHRRLSLASYPPDQVASWEDDVESVAGQAQWALSQLDGHAEVIAIEDTYAHRYAGDGRCDPFVLRSKIDLVLRNTDGSLEHIDYKTGAAKRDPIQETISRIVVASTFGDQYDEIRTTTLFVGEEVRFSEVLERHACRTIWEEIKANVATIQAAEAWRPVPMPLCSWCPYFENGCSLTNSSETAAAVTAWLDNDAD